MTTPLTIGQLFTPQPSGVGTNPASVPASGTWLADLIQIAQQVGLDTTAWQPGGPERTILAIAAVALAQEDSLVSQFNQGGFLDFAAAGTVTFYNIDGTTTVKPITPDPSILSQNPDGSPGWLDLLASSRYGVTRIDATYATGPLAIVKQSAGTVSFNPGTYHVANTSTGKTYSNASALSIPSSAIAGTGGAINGVTIGSPTSVIQTQTAHGLATGQTVYLTGIAGITGLNGKFAQVTGTPTATSFTVAVASSGAWSSGGTVYLCTVASFAADVKGIASNASPGAVTSTITQATGVSVSNLASWSATNYESNAALAARCRLSLAKVSPNGPAQVYAYVALTAQQTLAAQVPAVALNGGAITNAIAFSNPQTGIVEVVISSASPASSTVGQPVVEGCAQLGIVSASNATPIIVGTSTPHGLATNDAATIAGILGNTAANGFWFVTYLSPTTFSLNGSVGSGAYTGGGTVEGGDLGQIDALIQAQVVPDGIVAAITQSALALPVAVSATVVVPQAFAANYRATVNAALAAYLATLPIGGNVPPGGGGGTVPISAIEGALIDSGVQAVGGVSYVRQVTSLLVNGAPSDLPYPAPEYVALLGTPTITVVGV
jgi:hypothetical protein